MNHDEMIAVLQAHKEGGQIQQKYTGSISTWEPFDGRWLFISDWEYRIKPQPRTIWVNEYDDCCHVHHSQKNAEVNAEANLRYGKLLLVRAAVEYQEVIL